ncbi:O-antigen ligase [Psychroserpens sp. SPM9]|uniref:O-antigen ligase family protein n=1 Tax=Psychroserpens sp. SPM9 TaxID=2975598 RepID=UPI0021A47223|nr:O-antigen ligase family protein [Psychroserpens sp. SPM9]MDG5491108.1 O-antigen ligase family protein [Psychroserpens sp. SPM9]
METKIAFRQLSYNSGVILLLLAYLGSVYFSMAAPNIVLGVALFVFVLGVFTKKLQLNFTNKKWLLYGIVTVPILLTMLSVLNSTEIGASLKYIWKRIPILVIPFVLIFMNYEKKDIKNGLKLFIGLTVLAALITLYNAIKYVNEDILFKTDFTHFITVIQHPYFGVYTLIALLSIIELNLIKHRVLKIMICLLLLMAIVLTTSRLVYVVFLAYSCYFLFAHIPRKWFLGFGALLIIFAVTFLSLNHKIYNKFTSFVDYDKSPRLQLWNNAIKVIEKQDAYWSGIGIGDYYENKKDPYFAKGRGSGVLGFNPHSQPFEFYITNGFFGIILLTVSFFGIIFYLRKQEYLVVFFCTIIFLFSVIECIFSRQYGVQLYSVIIPIALSENFTKRKDEFK